MAKNFNNGKSYQKRQPKQQQQKKSNYFVFKLVVPADIPDSVYEEILNVLSNVPFNKISFPISTYRAYLDNTVDDNDTRVITTGYIKGFNPDTNEFSLIVFPNNRDIIANFKEPVVEVVYTEYPEPGTLGTITKFNIIDMNDNEEAEEVPAQEEPVKASEPVKEEVPVAQPVEELETMEAFDVMSEDTAFMPVYNSTSDIPKAEPAQFDPHDRMAPTVSD